MGNKGKHLVLFVRSYLSARGVIHSIQKTGIGVLAELIGTNYQSPVTNYNFMAKGDS